MTIMPTTTLADRLFAEAFDPWRCRTPRSDAYKAGVLAVLRAKESGVRITGVLYADGTAEADAYYAGCAEGHVLWREHLSS